MNSIYLPDRKENNNIEPDQLENINFQFAYRAMIGELAPSFLHELNNPLTVLSSSSALLQKLSHNDSDFECIIENIIDGSVFLVKLSGSFRQILNASTSIGISNTQKLCKDLLFVWEYRFKKESLAPEVFITENSGKLILSAKEFYFILFAMLELCLQIFNYTAPARELAHRLKIRLSSDKERNFLLSVCLPEWTCRKLADMHKQLKQVFAQFIPTFLVNHISEFFSFVLEQTYRIFQHRRIKTEWQTEQNEIILQLVVPCDAPEL